MLATAILEGHHMRPTKLSTLVCAVALAAAPLAACSSSSSSGSSAHPTLTYWASNQGTSLQDDRQVLGPQIAKFTKQTGIKVNFQVIPWTTLLTQITAATVSGKGPGRPQHRQYLVRVAPGDRRVRSLHLFGHEQDRRLQPLPDRQPLGHRRTRQAADGRPVVQPGLRPVLQQGSVRRGRHQRAAHHVGAADRRRQEAHQGRPLGADAGGRPDSGERPPGVRAEPAARADRFSTRPASPRSTPRRTWLRSCK